MDKRNGVLVPEARNEESGEPAGWPMLTGRLSQGWAALLGIGWPLAWLIGTVVEPAPANPHEAVPLWVSATAMVLFSALLMTLMGAVLRSGIAVYSGLVFGAIAVAVSATCPLTGHHGFGLWWVAQFTLLTGMLGANLTALRSASRS